MNIVDFIAITTGVTVVKLEDIAHLPTHSSLLKINRYLAGYTFDNISIYQKYGFVLDDTILKHIALFITGFGASCNTVPNVGKVTFDHIIQDISLLIMNDTKIYTYNYNRSKIDGNYGIDKKMDASSEFYYDEQQNNNMQTNSDIFQIIAPNEGIETIRLHNEVRSNITRLEMAINDYLLLSGTQMDTCFSNIFRHIEQKNDGSLEHVIKLIMIVGMYVDPIGKKLSLCNRLYKCLTLLTECPYLIKNTC